MKRLPAPEPKRLPLMPSLCDLLKLYRIRAIKQLSQNFLLRTKYTDKIVKAAGRIEEGFICEVGPGPGGITRSILNRNPKQLLLIEKDMRFKPMLQPLVEVSNDWCKVNLKFADILDLDMKSFPDESYHRKWDEPPPNIHVIGNLPFDVSTILIIRWMEDISRRANLWSLGRAKMTLTFQKEVAERIVAPILSKARCRMSVMCQNWCEPSHKFTISGNAFVPRPKVDVGVVHFVPRIKPVIDMDFRLIEKVTRTVFGMRQKYISRGVGKLFPEQFREQFTKDMFHLTDLDPQMRSFQLTVEEFGRLCRAYATICDKDPHLYNYNYRDPKASREQSWMKGAEETDEDECEGEATDKEEYEREATDEEEYEREATDEEEYEREATSSVNYENAKRENRGGQG